ncbi:MAG: enoyl-CoA hydratase/isomerase family protein [Chloroflexota bacterium]
MAYKTLRVEKSDAITTIYLNRPSQRNALNSELIDDLRALTDELRGDESTRAVIVTGAGKAFSVGADVEMLRRIGEAFTPEETRAEIVKWRETFDAVEHLPQITIAAINGLTYGGGVVLALACDFRIASTHAIFGLPEIKLGMVLALGGTQRLTRLIGVSAAKEMILRGRNVTAYDSQRMGLVHRIAEPGELMGLARSWAERAMGYSPRALALAKDLINRSLDRDANISSDAETNAQAELLHSPEFLGRLKVVKDNGEL